MTIEDEGLYKRITSSVVSAISEEWLSAKIEAIFYPGMSVYFGEYCRKSDGIARSLEGDARDGAKAIRELRRKFKEAGRPLWGKFLLELSRDGKFNVNLDYEKCDANGDAFYDEEEERARDFARHKRLTILA